MSGSYPSPRAKECGIKADLLAKITALQAEIAELQEREAQAMARSDRITDALVTADMQDAQRRRTALLLEFQDHVERHGC